MPCSTVWKGRIPEGNALALRKDRAFRHPSEGLALLYLERLGHRLVAHNYHARIGEIDLITLEDEEPGLHFVEVKSWRETEFRHPLESLDSEKRRRMRYAAKRFLLEWGKEAPSVHFDLIWVRADSGVELFGDLF